MKDAYYFPHDFNAIQDPKMMTLLSECGLMGIGMYWVIIEILHQQESGKITEEEFKKYLKFYFKIDQHKGNTCLTKLQHVLIKCELLSNTDGFVYSERVLRNKEIRENIREKRSFAGKKSAEVRSKSTHVEHMLTSVEQNPTNEMKGNERKGNDNHPAKNAGTPFKNPKHVDLKDIQIFCKEGLQPLDELGKHKLFNIVIDLFTARGWDTEGNMPLQVFKSVAVDVNEYKPKQVIPYFEKALKNYLNQNADLLSAQTKINRKNDKKNIPTIGELLKTREA